MANKQINFAVRNYILSKVKFLTESPIEYKKTLEDTREFAFKYWDSVIKLHEDSCVSLIRLEHNYDGLIYAFCTDHYVSDLEDFCKCDDFLDIISIIAKSSAKLGIPVTVGDIKRKYPTRYIEISFN